MTAASLPALVQAFFTDRLLRQRRASPHTVAGYRDTFRLLLRFALEQLGKTPTELEVEDLARRIREIPSEIAALGNAARQLSIEGRAGADPRLDAETVYRALGLDDLYDACNAMREAFSDDGWWL